MTVRVLVVDDHPAFRKALTSALGMVEVTGTSDELVAAVLEDSVRDAVEPPPPERDRVEMGFWHWGPHGASRNDACAVRGRLQYPEPRSVWRYGLTDCIGRCGLQSSRLWIPRASVTRF